MPSTIVSDMSICDRKIKVTVTDNGDGTMAVDLESDCQALEGFSKNLKTITMEDVVSFETSRINREEVRGGMSMICVAPIMVYQAAWMECGMLSKRIFGKQGPIKIDMGEERSLFRTIVLHSKPNGRRTEADTEIYVDYSLN